ncbi:flavin reductase family protein [Leucobacter tenebrionis]|uniref:flavin reductase family protein n=1 Tax=Leucobacter tenebrionis TaxID=2873270 RepID=UPI001CA70D97|nr:flavin reductase [Leucobacter tenebrionis]QZY50717.1 flavin reductase [Leucobacter tenebrionis]
MTATAQKSRVTADDFKFAFRHHPAGVAVVTADAGNGPVAMTVSSMSSVAIDPPTLVFSASPLSSATPTIREAETVVVHLIASDQVDLARLGARSGADRFGDDVEWGRLPTGEPYYPNATEWLRGRVARLFEINGSVLVIVEALEAKPREGREDTDESPLVYHNRTWHSIGDHTQLP